MRVWQRLKSALCFFVKFLCPSMTAFTERKYRAHALMCACVSLKGEFDAERLLGLADEFYQYITGDDDAALPRPDKASKGKLPRPR
jgi:hypothetical protein